MNAQIKSLCDKAVINCTNIGINLDDEKISKIEKLISEKFDLCGYALANTYSINPSLIIKNI